MLRVSSAGRRAPLGAVSAALAVLLLASCGQQDAGSSAQEAPKTPASSSSSPSPSPKAEKTEKEEKVPPGTPDCSQVWEQGSTIPRTYQGCADKAGSYVERDTLACSSGQRVVRYGDRFWGVLGGTINEANGSLDDDHDYKVSMRNCSA